MGDLGGMRFVVKTADDGQRYFVILAAGNHAVLCTSETYAREVDVLRAVELVMTGAKNAAVVVET